MIQYIELVSWCCFSIFYFMTITQVKLWCRSFLKFNFLFLRIFIEIWFRASKTLSFNAGLFASICLASRFHTSSIHTFGLTTIAFILFALLPDYRKIIYQVNLIFLFSFIRKDVLYLYFKKKSKISIVILTILELVMCVFMFAQLRLWSYLILYLVTFGTITFISPTILIRLQKKKR